MTRGSNVPATYHQLNYINNLLRDLKMDILTASKHALGRAVEHRHELTMLEATLVIEYLKGRR